MMSSRGKCANSLAADFKPNQFSRIKIEDALYFAGRLFCSFQEIIPVMLTKCPTLFFTFSNVIFGCVKMSFRMRLRLKKAAVCPDSV